MSDLLKVKVGGSDYLCRWEKSYTVKIGGKRYPYVQIGNNLWLAENLDYAWEGLDIGGTSTPSTPHAWYYNNDKNTYGIDGTYKCGLLYNGYAAQYLDANKATLLPDGWHVPDYDELVGFLSQLPEFSQGWNAAAQAARAKNNSVTSDWPSNWNGDNTHGLNVLPAGHRHYQGSSPFGYFGQEAILIGKTGTSTVNAIAIQNYFGTTSNMNSRGAGSIRLIKNLA